MQTNPRFTQTIEMFEKKVLSAKIIQKKYPQTLDNAFLRLYLCIVIRKTNQHNSKLITHNLKLKKTWQDQ